MAGAERPGGPPTDWGSGERVFGPPAGTLDVDWLVPAVLERVLVDPAAALEALELAWHRLRVGGPEGGGTGGAGVVATDEVNELALAADAVLIEALEQYRVDPGQAGRRED